MHLSELKALHVSALIKMGEELEIENVARLRKQELMFAIMKKRAKAGEQVFGDGVLEVLPDGFGFLRSIEASTAQWATLAGAQDDAGHAAAAATVAGVTAAATGMAAPAAAARMILRISRCSLNSG